MKIYYKDDIKTIERLAIESGFSEERMMENAGAAAASIITEKFDLKGKSVIIAAGNGNNGGDGFVVARKLTDFGANVGVILVSGMPKTSVAQAKLAKITSYPIRIYKADDSDSTMAIMQADYIIDAIFGIGFHGAVDDNTKNIIDTANNSSAQKIALDIPSGCECDNGNIANVCFSADMTITFIAVKPCHILYPSSDYCGKLIKVGIGIPQKLFGSVHSDINIIESSIVKENLPKRRKNFHKGSCGTATLLCGSYGMAGAAILSSSAALKSGVGLVRLALPKSLYEIVASNVHEAVYMPCNDSPSGTLDIHSAGDILKSIAASEAVLIGCGLGNTADTAKLFAEIYENSKTPMVVDADGINIISQNIDILMKSNAPVILTPHPAEMARLLQTTTAEIQGNRIKIAKAFAVKFSKILVLKGANTIVALPNGELYVCMCGNPGMATGGSGDVLAGIITSLLAQGMSPETAAICGVQLHASAGDEAAARLSMHSMLPSDIIDSLYLLFQKYEQ